MTDPPSDAATQRTDAASPAIVPTTDGLATHEFDLVCRILVRIALRMQEKEALSETKEILP